MHSPPMTSEKVRSARGKLRARSEAEEEPAARAFDLDVLRTALPSIAEEDVAPVIVATTVAKTKDAPVVGVMDRKTLFDAINMPRSSAEMCVREEEDAKVLGEFLLHGRLGGDSVAGEAHKMCRPYVCKDDGCECHDQSVQLAIKLIPFGSSTPGSARRAYEEIVVRKKGFHDPGLLKMGVGYEHPVEITTMVLLNELVLQGICPNLPLMFRYFVCDTCELVNKALFDLEAAWPMDYTLKINEQLDFLDSTYRPPSPTIRRVKELRKAHNRKDLKIPCIVVVNELANGGDLEHILQKQFAMKLLTKGEDEDAVARRLQEMFPNLNPNDRDASAEQRRDRRGKAEKLVAHAQTSREPLLTEAEVNSMLFQIVAGLYAMNKYYDMRHFDLHWGNVLVHNLPHSDGVLRYRIEGQDYFVPTYGRLYVLWDFGRVVVPKKMKAFLHSGMYANQKEALADMRQISELIDLGLDGAPSTKVDQLSEKNRWDNYGDVIRDVFSDYLRERSGVTSSWNMDKKLRRFQDKNLQRLVVPGMSE